MSSTNILLRSDVVIDHFEQQLRLPTDDANKLLKRSFIKF